MGVELIADLYPVLIMNYSKVNFVTSDAPVVLYNYVKIKNHSLLGFQSPGLQIYCPLTEKVLLLLVDMDFYNIHLDSGSIVTIRDISDINELNKLQYLNCLHTVICSGGTDVNYLRNLHDSIKDNIEKTKMTCSCIMEQTNGDGRHSEIIKTSKIPLKYNLKLSFLKLNHQKNKTFKPMAKKAIKKNPLSVFIRNKESIEIVKKRIKDKYNEAKKSFKD